jgi:cation transport regulator ChaB
VIGRQRASGPALIETRMGGYTEIMPTKKEDLPSTLKRSPKKVQDTYAKTLDSAEETYDSEERAHRAAWASVKHVAEKQGDHWETKEEYGPSDPQSAQSGRQARDNPRESYGGVDASKSKQELYEQAKDAGVEGRSNMSKQELAEALRRANDRATRKARS